MLAAAISTDREESLGLEPSTVAVPVTSLKAPRTLVTIAWRVTKPIRLWLASRVKVPLTSARVAIAVVVVLMVYASRC